MLDSGELVEIPLPTGSTEVATKSQSPRQSTIDELQQLMREKSSSSIGECPLCGATVVEQKKSFVCSKWRCGCRFKIWKRMSGKRVSVATIKILLRDGQTDRLQGFKSKAGKAFDARLKLVDGAVRFEFDG
jgi:DNA topoisomerase-3